MADPELTPVDDRPAVLTIAGLDSSGGAGIILDAAVIRAFGRHPLSVLTSIPVQNTNQVGSRHDLPPAIIAEQLERIAEEFLPGAVKVGLLGRKVIVETVASWLADRPRLPLVLDPVLRAGGGAPLVEAGLEHVLVRHLLPRARVITPNLEEAEILTGRTVTGRDEMPEAAEAIREMGPRWVLLKGGHLNRGMAADFLAGPETGLWLEGERYTGGNVRGTGCVLATALAVRLGAGDSVPDAARSAKAFVSRSLESAYIAGEGRFLDFPPVFSRD